MSTNNEEGQKLRYYRSKRKMKKSIDKSMKNGSSVKKDFLRETSLLTED